MRVPKPLSVAVTAIATVTAMFAFGGSPAAADPAFIGKASGANAATSLTVGAPAGVASGDVQLAVVGIGTSSETATTPTGWTLEDTLTHLGGTEEDSFRAYVFSSTTATGATTFTKSGTRAWQIVRVAYDASDGVTASDIQVRSEGTNHATPFEIADEVGDMLVGGVVSDGSSPSSQSFTPPTGWVERHDERAAAEGVTVTVADDALSATGSQNGTFTSSSADESITFSVLLDTAAATPPPGGNTPPDVNAGTDSTATLPATASLDGTVTDDALPTGSSVSSIWMEVSGPGTVTFGNSKAVDTSAAFSTDGTYVLRLVATDGALSSFDDVTVTVNPEPTGGGGSEPPAEPGDITPPQTTIASAPNNPTSSQSATFYFTSNEPATFECKLDGSAYSACASPKTYSNLALGGHTFWVRAVDGAGNVDPTPAEHAWGIISGTDTGVVNPSGPPGNWTLEFNEEFSGTSLDTSKWESSWFDGGSMNNVATSPSNVSVANGEVRLQLSNASTGALIHTGGGPGGVAGRYGMEVGDVVEARAWFPGNGTDLFNWPAWWVVSTYDGVSGSQVCGEHDIAEVLSDHDLTINYHSPSGAHNQGAQPGYWGDAWHTYTLHRKATSADVYWDGVLMESYPTDDEGCPIDVVLNVGALSSTTSGVSPVTGSAGALRVDYVKAWEPAP